MKRALSALAMLFFLFQVRATHIVGAEIYYEQDSIDPYTVHATVNVFTSFNSAINNIPVNISWGDGIVDSVFASDTTFIDLSKYSVAYKKSHTYSALPPNGQTGYNISCTILNRSDGVANISNGNTGNLPVYVESFLPAHILETKLGHRSPRIVSLPDITAATNVLHHDSLLIESYYYVTAELTVPLQSEGVPVPLYEYPDAVTPNLPNVFVLDTAARVVIWNSPKQIATYAVAIKLYQYEHNTILGYVMRDYLIYVEYGLPVGVDEFIDPKNFVFYSNGALHVTSEKAGESNIVLFDAVGRKVLNQLITDNHTAISCSHLPAGVYIYAFTEGEMLQQRGKLMLE